MGAAYRLLIIINIMRANLTFLFFLISLTIFSQTTLTESQIRYAAERYEDVLTDLPDGLYGTLADLKAKQPTQSLDQFESVSNQAGIHRLKWKGGRMYKKNAACFVKNGELYVHALSIGQHRSNDSKLKPAGKGKYYKFSPNGRFLVSGAMMVPPGAVIGGFFVGGVVGAVIAGAITNKERVIIYIPHLSKFRIVSNVNHFRQFVTAKYPNNKIPEGSIADLKKRSKARSQADVIKYYLQQL